MRDWLHDGAGVCGAGAGGGFVVAALEAARITGAFAAPVSTERASALRNGLDAHRRLQRDLAALRVQAGKEKQINRRVQLNIEIKRLEAEIASTGELLKPS